MSIGEAILMSNMFLWTNMEKKLSLNCNKISFWSVSLMNLSMSSVIKGLPCNNIYTGVNKDNDKGAIIFKLSSTDEGIWW